MEDIFRSRFSEWIKSLMQHLNKKFLKENQNQIVNISDLYLMRNAFVHNNGIVNNNYIKSVSENNKYELGEKIKISSKFLKEKITELESLAFDIYNSYLLRILKDYNDTFNVLNSIILRNIDRNIPAISNILKMYSSEAKLEESSKLVAKINYFLHEKAIENYDIVEEEIKSFKVRHLSKDFQIAKYLLMDSDTVVEEFTKYINELSDQDFFSKYDWPLFKFTKFKTEIEEVLNKRLEKILGVDNEN